MAFQTKITPDDSREITSVTRRVLESDFRGSIEEITRSNIAKAVIDTMEGLIIHHMTSWEPSITIAINNQFEPHHAETIRAQAKNALIEAFRRTKTIAKISGQTV